VKYYGTFCKGERKLTSRWILVRKGVKRSVRMWQMEALIDYIGSAETVDFIIGVLVNLVILFM
jgi:hypothetical protein